MDPARNELQQALARQQQQAAAAGTRHQPHNNNAARRKRQQQQQPVNFPEILEPVHVIDEKFGRIKPSIMNKDGQFTQVHLHRPRDADLLEQFCRDKLPSGDIYVPAQHQPVNPEDEDDVVPDQHAAFGIQRATQARKEPAWRDHGLGELMNRGPGGMPGGAWRYVGRGGGGEAGVPKAPRGPPSRLPR